ncbi:uncharacterized protein GGS22DRAFT_195148 [Annulohypoxylon maeteangense]|uniref:uncharacterized protein n=1 Tax=Annulohypoxylon maeteangense TaxID=1927788 RepID=UPI002008B85C|nr:uncharacterized protein GGS22DRAFT_195148 [Annulohypoxylon maeteangense]KAI0883384.1 hypothetical protein GGS22DRAFT_195148 [Annulohypoxylon maeteangense]
MDSELYYEADGDRGRTHEHREPITMTFEPNEYSPTSSPSRQPSRLQALAECNNALHSNLQQQQEHNHQHHRQQSVPDLYAEARTPSPASRARHHSQDMPLTGDGRVSRRQDNSPGRFGGWLNTPSAGDSSGHASPVTTPTPKTTTPSRLGFFASLTGRLTTQTPSTPNTPTTPNITITTPSSAPNGRETSDELLNLDVETALYPSPSERTTFSPAAYKNLQQNASGLLHRMQDAYRTRTISYKELVAEREAQREEAEETELRVRSLRAQLESMAAKAQEQEMAMRRLVAELRFERSAREGEREEERRERGRLEREIVGLIGSRDKNGEGDGEGEGGLCITEDLCVDEERERKRWRKSDGTVRSDLSIDTDDVESAESESIFSRSRSPTAMTSATESEVNAELLSVRTPPTGQGQGQKKGVPPQQLTTFQRLVKGISGDGTGGNAAAGGGVDECRNCRGQDSSVAWDTVSLLRDENRGLKHRVAELEVVVDGALDVVNGIGLP